MGAMNATKLFPAPLLRRMQRHFEGGLVWVPARERQRRKTVQDAARNARIMRLRALGFSVCAIARRRGRGR